jgi:O-antigen/teichoic acid export membrane protein
VTEVRPGLTDAERVGARAAVNTTLRATAEILGKLVSLVLFAAIAREGGQAGLGAFVLAFAYGQIVLVPVDFGLDRQLTRRVAETPEAAARMWVDVIALKAALLVPILGLGIAILPLLGYHGQTPTIVLALLPGLAFDSLARSAFSVLMGFERAGPIAIGTFTQRATGAGLGILALSLGYGVPVAAAAYSVGAALGFGVTVLLLGHLVPLRGTGGAQPAKWRRLLRTSTPFGFQEVFSVLLFRLDAVLLSFLASGAAIGRYGAAYRLFEGTLFIGYSLASAFSAMYTYLGKDSVPTIGAAFGRSLKSALAILVPCAVGLALLARPILSAIFGDDFAAAAPTLRLLAVVVVLVALVTLSASLVVARSDAAAAARLTGSMVALNVVLNVVLIPLLDERGAALALVVTEVALLLALLRIAKPLVGHLDWRATATGPLAAGAVMAAVMAIAPVHWILVGTAGAVVYLAVLVLVERATCPNDVAFVRRLLTRGRLPA